MLIKYERGFISQMKYLFSTHYSTVKRRQDSILWAHATIYTDSLKQRTMTTYITLIAFIFKCGWYWASLVAQRLKHLPAMWETRVQSLAREDPLESKRQPTPVFPPVDGISMYFQRHFQ